MKILHLSFHKGCINEFNYICDKLGYECHVLSQILEWNTNKLIQPIFEDDNQQYNITKDRANKYWKLYETYFNDFDSIITSDTAPLSRIFLQNNWNKPLIICICNRFDYSHGCNSGFPDKEYYTLFKQSYLKNKIKIIGYTEFENYYCKAIRGVDIGNSVITPCGGISELYKNFISKPELNNTFFIPPYHNDTIMMNLPEKIKELGYNSYSGKYNGPMDLLNYKAVIHIPYAWSNLAFFEMVSLGIIYFVPSIDFLNILRINKDFFWSPPFIQSSLNLSEWYNEDHKKLLIYFDSWEDLILKINSLNYDEHKKKLKGYGKILETDRLNKWKLLFNI
jgi:hypothetical protein